jgi:hypothetical protein
MKKNSSVVTMIWYGLDDKSLSPVEADIFLVSHLWKRCVLYSMLYYWAVVKWLNCVTIYLVLSRECTELYLHSLGSLSYDRSIPFFKGSSPSSSSPVKFKYLTFYLRSASSYLHLVHLLILSFKNMFQMAVPMQDVTSPVSLLLVCYL